MSETGKTQNALHSSGNCSARRLEGTLQRLMIKNFETAREAAVSKALRD